MSTQGNDMRLNRNWLNKWMTLSTASGDTKSWSLRHLPISHQSLTSTHPEMNQQRMQQSNIMQRHSMNFKPSLLQWFGEENFPRMHYNEGEEVLTQPSFQGTSILTLQSTSLFPSSVENQRSLLYLTLPLVFPPESSGLPDSHCSPGGLW